MAAKSDEAPKSNEELENRREELFEVFKAGYEAATNWYQGQAEDPHDHDDDVRRAFEEWLDEQFAEVSRSVTRIA